MRDETVKDNHQTTAWISHDLIRNNELAFDGETCVVPWLAQLTELLQKREGQLGLPQHCLGDFSK